MKKQKTAVLFLSVLLFFHLSFSAYSEANSQTASAEELSKAPAEAMTNQQPICGQIDPDRNLAYVVASDRGEFSVIDIQNPDKPVHMASLEISDPEPVSSMLFPGDFVYLLSGNSVQVVDVSKPLEPVWCSQIAVQTDYPLEGIVMDGQRIYLYNRGSVQVFSLEDNPALPVFAGFFEVNAEAGKELTDIAVRNGVVYAAMGSGGVHIYSFKDPEHVSDIGRISEVQGACEDIALAGELVLMRISHSDPALSRIEVMNVSDSANPKYKGSIRNYGIHMEDSDAAAYGNMLVLADHSKRVRLINPEKNGDGQVGYIDAAAIPICIKIREGSLYLLDESGGFHVIQMEPSVFTQAGISGTTASAISGTTTGVKPGKSEKTAYITIDDGPSRNNTTKNLDTLKKYGIKATFFVLPREHLDDIYKRILEEGHVLGNHSSVHDYNYLYSSTANFEKDVIKARDFIYKKLGYTTTVYRFPGGTMGRKKSVVAERTEILKNLGYRYFDWDVSTADTDPNLSKYGSEEKIVNLLANNVIKNTKGKKKLIILMHDSAGKAYTAKALPKIIEGLQKQGYGFDVLTNY